MWSQDGLTTTGHYVLPNANSTSQAHDDPLPSPFITAPKRPFMLAYPGGFDLSAEHGTATATQHQQVQTPNTPQVAQYAHKPSIAQSMTPPLSRPQHQISARAAELKAQLLRNRGQRTASTTPQRGSPGTPMMAANQISDTEGGSRASNQLPNQEDVDDLLAQYAPQTDDAVEIPTIVESFKDYNTPISSRESPQPAATAIPSTAMSLAPPRRTTSAGDMSNRAPSESSRHGHDDSISEGEIVEDPPPSMMPPFQPGAHTNLPDTSAGFLRRESIKVLQRRQTRGDSPSHAAPMDSNKANYDMSDQPGPKWRPTGAPVPQERDRRSAHDALGRLPEKRHSNHVESSDQEKSPMPTLSDFLSHNDDLREWLEITNYSNKTYRDRILSTHREIVALEVKRTQLLSGMKVTGLTPPTKIELEVPERVASTPTNKRPFTEMQDPRDEYSNPAHKMSRNNEHWPVYDREARDDGWPRSEGPRGRRRSPASPYQPREPDRSYSPPGYNEPRHDSLDTDHQADRRASYSNIRGTPRGHAHDGVNAGFGRARGAPARADYWNSTRGRRGGP